MKTNNKKLPIILSAFNAVVCLILLIFCVPKNVPLLAGIHDEIVVISSKWWLTLGIIIPLIFMLITLKSKSKYTQLIFSELIIFIAFDNFMAYAFYISSPSFYLGMISEVPLSVAVFIPVAVSCFVYGSMIKNIPYKHKLGLNSKLTQTTEFIWIQTHITGSYYYRLTGLILFIVSIIFSFIHFPLIELAIFIIGLLIPRIIIEINARQMTNKYKVIKAKHDHLTSKKAKPQ